MKEIKGSLIVTLKTGECLAAQSIRIAGESLEIASGPFSLTTTINDLEKVYLLREPDQIPVAPELLKITAALLKIEKLAALFKRQHPNFREPRMILFESTSLSLTILPDRVSHDVDVATNLEFQKFLREQTYQEAELKVEALGMLLLNKLGYWQNRTSRLTGMEQTVFEIMHPLDTLAQKLLRNDPVTFEEKDQPDIEAIMQHSNPSKETLIFLLTENPLRYSPYPDEASLEAIRRNTTWFLKRFQAGLEWKELLQVCSEANRKEQLEAGLAPPPRSPKRLPGQTFGAGFEVLDL